MLPQRGCSWRAWLASLCPVDFERSNATSSLALFQAQQLWTDAKPITVPAYGVSEDYREGVATLYIGVHSAKHSIETCGGLCLLPVVPPLRSFLHNKNNAKHSRFAENFVQANPKKKDEAANKLCFRSWHGCAVNPLGSQPLTTSKLAAYDWFRESLLQSR